MQRKCGILCLRKSSVNIGYDVLCSVMSDSVTPWTIARQAPLSMGFPRQEYWSGLPFPSPGALPDPRAEPTSSALAGGFFTTTPPGIVKLWLNQIYSKSNEKQLRFLRRR